LILVLVWRFLLPDYSPGVVISCLARVSPLTGEVLFFAPPKKSTQKKGDPDGLPAI
jgi:hypothetical protein